MIGNKMDLCAFKACPRYQEIFKYCIDNELPFYEISALEGASVLKMLDSALEFHKFASMSRKSLKEAGIIVSTTIQITNDDATPEHLTDDCCS